MYLESIFLAGDIRAQLPEEAKKFDAIDKTFKKVCMKNAYLGTVPSQTTRLKCINICVHTYAYTYVHTYECSVFIRMYEG